MVINLVIIVVILASLSFAATRYVRGLDSGAEERDDIEDEERDIAYFVDETAKAFNRTLRQNLEGQNLTRTELRKRQE